MITSENEKHLDIGYRLDSFAKAFKQGSTLQFR